MFIAPIALRKSNSENSITSGDPAQMRELQTELEFTKGHIERMLMISEALWSILKEKHGYTDEELYRRVADIDLKDGKLDGRVKPKPPNSCSHCDRKLTKNRMVCLYCGYPVQLDLFER